MGIRQLAIANVPDSQPLRGSPETLFDFQTVKGILELFISGCKLFASSVHHSLCENDGGKAIHEKHETEPSLFERVRVFRGSFLSRRQKEGATILQDFADLNSASIIPLFYHARIIRRPTDV